MSTAPGGAHDLLGADARVAALREQGAGGRDQGRTRGLGLLGLGGAHWNSGGLVVLDIHTACMLDTYCLYVH